jgi:hypothetical protein
MLDLLFALCCNNVDSLSYQAKKKLNLQEYQRCNISYLRGYASSNVVPHKIPMIRSTENIYQLDK